MNRLSVLLLSGMLVIAAAASAQKAPAKKAARPAAAAAAAKPAFRVVAHQRADNTWGYTVYKNDAFFHGQDKSDGTHKGFAAKADAEAAGAEYVRQAEAQEKKKH